mmetsp:Transcript_60495/g.129806  ORF Transcript_60495/g.129806 Transcript_60495/m.129806 type:complete len:235 (+) Transcript_60495:2171-2875(+)
MAQIDRVGERHGLLGMAEVGAPLVNVRPGFYEQCHHCKIANSHSDVQRGVHEVDVILACHKGVQVYQRRLLRQQEAHDLQVPMICGLPDRRGAGVFVIESATVFQSSPRRHKKLDVLKLASDDRGVDRPRHKRDLGDAHTVSEPAPFDVCSMLQEQRDHIGISMDYGDDQHRASGFLGDSITGHQKVHIRVDLSTILWQAQKANHLRRRVLFDSFLEGRRMDHSVPRKPPFIPW